MKCFVDYLAYHNDEWYGYPDYNVLFKSKAGGSLAQKLRNITGDKATAIRGKVIRRTIEIRQETDDDEYDDQIPDKST